MKGLALTRASNLCAASLLTNVVSRPARPGNAPNLSVADRFMSAKSTFAPRACFEARSLNITEMVFVFVVN